MIPKRDDIFAGVHGNGGFWGKIDSSIRNTKTVREILKDYSVEEILNNIDTEEIELYLRKKKLDKITKKTRL